MEAAAGYHTNRGKDCYNNASHFADYINGKFPLFSESPKIMLELAQYFSVKVDILH